MNDKIYNELTEYMDELMIRTTKYKFETYILDEVFKGAMAIRVPGITLGGIKINEKNEVIEVEIFEDVLSKFKDKKVSEILTKEFKGFKIK